MKKTTRPKKLALRLETVRVLTSQDLLLVAGGACKDMSQKSVTRPPDPPGAALDAAPRPKTC